MIHGFDDAGITVPDRERADQSSEGGACDDGGVLAAITFHPEDPITQLVEVVGFGPWRASINRGRGALQPTRPGSAQGVPPRERQSVGAEIPQPTAA